MISTIELVKWLNADEDAPDVEAEIGRLRDAAVEFINEPGGVYFGPVAEVTENIVWRGGTFRLASTPIDGAVTFERFNGSGAWEAEAASGFLIDGRLVFPQGSASLPAMRHLRATYEAGYEADATEPEVWAAPEDVKQAVRMLVAHWFLNRESVVVGQASAEVEQSVAAILRKYR